MKAIITVGVSASGKSTWAREWYGEDPVNRSIICRDDTRINLVARAGRTFSWAKWKWSREQEVSEIQERLVQAAANAHLDICIADTNLNVQCLAQLQARLTNLGYEVETKYFQVSYGDAVKRDTARPNPVGAIIIGKQFAVLRKHQTPYHGGAGLPTAVLCDIDGTLAHMNGKRGPFEWDKVDLDDVDNEVKTILDTFYDSGDTIILLSGRDGVSTLPTHRWLDKKHVDYHHLFMRAEGDMRSDAIVKRELFEAHIAGKYNVRMVLDDRPKVCRMWRDLGLKVLQFGDPHVEF